MCNFSREEKNLKRHSKRRDKKVKKKNQVNKTFSRNEPCSCGSTLKFKDCCGRE